MPRKTYKVCSWKKCPYDGVIKFNESYVALPDGTFMHLACEIEREREKRAEDLVLEQYLPLETD